MSDDHFNYDQLMLDAHRTLIRQVLLKVLKSGLPGEHHFFIIFSTTHQGTRISDRLRAQYPKEMTIVLQHQYSNLKVHDDYFEIQLSFNRIPELLVVPFKAITGFVDPSVPFGLQLAGDAAAGLENSIGMLVPGLPQGTSPVEGDSPEIEAAFGDDLVDIDDMEKYEIHAVEEREENPETVVGLWGDNEETSVPSVRPSNSRSQDTRHDDVAAESSDDTSEQLDNEDDDTETANIVQLDAFRKKS